MKFKLLAATLSGFAFISMAHAAGDAQAGQSVASTKCIACHSLDGNSVNPQWPSIAGQHADYIVKQVKAIRAGERSAALMQPMVADITDQQIEDVAAYYSTQHIKGQDAAKSAVELGQKIYRGGVADSKIPACLACHGPSGRGIEGSSYPQLRSQHAVYLTAQLQAYKAGTRKTDQSEIMRDIAARLSDKEIDALAQYIQGLR